MLLLSPLAVTAYWTAPRLADHETIAELLSQSICTETFVGAQGTAGSRATGSGQNITQPWFGNMIENLKLDRLSLILLKSDTIHYRGETSVQARPPQLVQYISLKLWKSIFSL